jgi:transposase
LAPIDTERLIRMHDAAFHYFASRPQECVYDPGRLVVIEECYRELTLNERFAQYATTVGFQVRACAGYDPETQGKVEAGMKYVKHNGLYGEAFENARALAEHLRQWLDETANQRASTLPQARRRGPATRLGSGPACSLTSARPI